jgi:hypothetical protein
MRGSTERSPGVPSTRDARSTAEVPSHWVATPRALSTRSSAGDAKDAQPATHVAVAAIAKQEATLRRAAARATTKKSVMKTPPTAP